MKFKNYINTYTGDNRIYSLNDITQMSLGDVLKNKEELLSQYRVLGVPTEKELQDSDNVVYVKAYTRDDGTEVKAHYRSKPEGGSDNNTNSLSGTPTGGASEIDNKQEYTQDKPLVDVSTPEKVEKLMYPDEIAGVKRGEPKTLLEVAQQGVNPNYNPENEDEDAYSINCSSTVFSADMQCRGYNVEAVSGSISKVEELSEDVSCGYLDPKTGKPCTRENIEITDNDSVYNYVQNNFPAGSRCILRYKTKLDVQDSETYAHRTMIGKNHDGTIVVFDPQDGEYHEGKDAQDYIGAWINPKTVDTNSYTAILRIDDKIPNPYYMHEVVQHR